jgi:hypothetical protein
MRTRAYFFAVVLLLVQSSGTMGQDKAPQIREAELRKTPISAGPLRITITEFKASSLLIPFSHIKMQVENPSDSFAAFSPNKLMFVGNEGAQSNIFGVCYSPEPTPLGPAARYEYIPAADRDLAPNTHISLWYVLTDKVDLPARLFYDRQEIADIAK